QVAQPRGVPIANNFDCPGGCPPATVNIFCQPHPDRERFPNRVIFKFTSISEKTLNDVFGFKPETAGNFGNNAGAVALNVAHRVRLYVATNAPPLNTSALPPAQAAEIQTNINESLDAMELVVSAALSNAVSAAGANLYVAVRDTLYE